MKFLSVNWQKGIAKALIVILAGNPVVMAAYGVEHAIDEQVFDNRIEKLAFEERLRTLEQITSQTTPQTTSTQTTTSSYPTNGPITFAAGQQGALSLSADGVPVVNIAAPTSGGVSHNQFYNYNVTADGVILNNALDPTISILGGWTDGNRRLTGGTANLILAEVTGTNRSNLLGLSEILGNSAELVLANPNGITCDGCGFINIPRVVLATGKPELTNGMLTGIDIVNGDVLIDGAGLNASNVSQLDILTRAIKLNAALYANELNIFTGINSYDFTSGTHSQSIAEGDNENRPQFALDASALGAMYADKIKLIGTEAGLGVRSEGLISSTESMQLTADGKLQLKDAVSQGQLNLISKNSEIQTDGSIYGQTVKIDAANRVTNNGLIAAKDELALSATSMSQYGDVLSGINLAGEWQETASAQLTLFKQLDNQGNLLSTGSLDINTDELLNSTIGALQAKNTTLNTANLINLGAVNSDKLSIDAKALNNAGQIQANFANLNVQEITQSDGLIYQTTASGEINVSGQYFVLENGNFVVEGSANIALTGQLENNASSVFNSNTSILTSKFINTGTIAFNGSTVVNSETLSNGGIALFSDANSTAINVADLIDNENGLLQFAGQASVIATQLDNSQGQISHIGEGTFNVHIGEDINNQAGLFQVATESNITAKNLNNANGQIFQLNDENLTIEIESDFNNSAGQLKSSGALQLTANNAVNQNGSITAVADFALNANQINNELGHIGTEQLSLTADALNNLSGVVSADNATIVTRAVNNTNGIIEGSGELSIQTNEQINNEKGLISSENNLQIVTSELLNNQGTLVANQRLSLEANAITNHDSSVISANTIDAVAQLLDNSVDSTIEGERVSLLVTDIVNKGSILATDENDQSLSITAESLINRGSIESHGENFTLSDMLLNNTNGQIVHQGTGVLQLFVSGKLANQQGQIQSSAQIIANSDEIDNTNGLIGATNNVIANSALITNIRGEIISGGRAQLSTDYLNNTDGSIVLAGEGTSTIQATTALDNINGHIASNGSLQIDSTTVNNSGEVQSNLLFINAESIDNQGAIQASNATLNTTDLLNQGTILATDTDGEALVLSSENGITNAGHIQSNSHTFILQDFLNNQNGTLTHLGTGVLSLRHLNNQQGDIYTASNLDIDGDVNNVDGNIQAEGKIAITGNAINNQSGQLNTSSELDIAVATLDNRSGEIFSSGTTSTIEATDNLLNENGSIISSAEQLSITSANIELANGVIAGENNVEIISQNLNLATDGQLQAQQLLNIAATDLSNQGIINAREVDLTVTNLNNQHGTVEAQTALNINAAYIDNAQGVLLSQNDIAVTVHDQTNGVALNNAFGHIAANGTFTLNTPYAVDNSNGMLLSEQVLHVQAKELDNSQGEILAGTQLTTNVSDSITNTDGIIASQGEMSLASQTLVNDGASQITQSGEGQLQLTLTRLVNESNISATTLNATIDEQIENRGDLQANTLNLYADNTINSGNIVAQEITLTGNNLINTNGTIATQGTTGVLQIESINTDNQFGVIQSEGGNLSLLTQLTNANGEVLLLGDGTLSINSLLSNNQGQVLSNDAIVLTGSVNNVQGRVAATNDLTVNANVVNNNTGTLSAGGSVLINADSLSNQAGEILAGNDIQAITTNEVDNSNKGLISSNGTLDIQAHTLNNSDGELASVESMDLTVSDVLNNTQGVIAANQFMQIDASDVNNSGEGLISSEQVVISSQSLLNSAQSQIEGERVTLNVNSIDNAGTILATGNEDESLLVDASVVNNQGIIESHGQDLTFADILLNNAQGQIIHFGTGVLQLSTIGTLNNQQGEIYASAQLVIEGADIDNTSGVIQANDTLSVTSTSITNASGKIASGNDTTLTTNSLDNTSGYVGHSGEGVLSINALTEVNNTAGQIVSNGALQIQTAALTNSGDIQSNVLLINADTFVNQGAVQGEVAEINSIDLLNQGSILATATEGEALILTAQNGITNEGHIQSDSYTFSIQDALNNQNGTLSHTGTGVLTLAALNNQQGEVFGAGDVTINGSLDNSLGLVQAHGSLNLFGDEVVNQQGQLLTANDLTVDVMNLDNRGGTIVSEGISSTINVNQSLLNQNGSITSTAQQLSVSASDLQLDSGVIAGLNNVAVDADNLAISTGGQLQAGEELAVTTTSFANQGVVDANNVHLSAVNIDNQNGAMEARSTLTVEADYLNNSQGVLLSQNDIELNLQGEQDNVALLNQYGDISANGTLTITTPYAIDNTNGLLLSEQALQVQANSLDNTLGEVLAGTHLSIYTDNTLDNTNGVLYSNADMLLSAHELRNAEAGQITQAGAGSMQLSMTSLLNEGDINATALTGTIEQQLSNSGTLQADAVNLTANQLFNSGTVVGNNISVSGSELINTNGIIATEGNNGVLQIDSTSTNNEGGVIQSEGGSLNLLTQLTNNRGEVLLLGDGTLSINGLLNNEQGQILSNGAIVLSGESANNKLGTVEATTTVQITASTIDNDSGTLYAGDTVTVNATHLSNQGGTLSAEHTIDLTLSGTLNNSNSGLIASQGTLIVDAQNINNRSGEVFSTAAMDLAASAVLDNTQGNITAASDATITATTLNNTQGVLQVNGQLLANAGQIDNTAGTIQVVDGQLNASQSLTNIGGTIEGQTLSLSTPTLNNTQGVILSKSSQAHSLQLSEGIAINNTEGVIGSNGFNWDLVLTSLNNQSGQLLHLGGGTFTLSQSDALTNSGVIASAANMVVNTDTLTNQGNIQAQQLLQVNAGVNNLTDGAMVANNITVNAPTKTVANAGSISASQNLNINAATLTNSSLLYGGNTTSVNANTITNTGTWSSNDLTATGFSVLQNNGRIESNKGSFSGTTLDNQSSGVLINADSSQDSLQLNTSQITNSGTLYSSAQNVDLKGSLTNSGDLIHAGTGVLLLGSSGTINNASGSIASAGTTTLKNSVSGAGTVFAEKGMHINTSGTFTNNSLLYTQGDLLVSSALNNQGGSLISDGNFTINTTGHVTNTGSLQGNNLSFTTGVLNNNSGTITSLGTNNAAISATTLYNNGGIIQSTNGNFAITTRSGELDNANGDILHQGTGVLSLSSKGQLDQRNGTIKTAGKLATSIDGNLNNAGGEMTASYFQIITNGTLTNTGGQITATGSGSSFINSGALTNYNGAIASKGSSLTLNTAALNNDNGKILHEGTGTLSISATSLTNNTASSEIKSNGAITINGGSGISNAGVISSNAQLTLSASNITNNQTMGSRSGKVDVNSTGTLTNRGTISGKTMVDADVTTLNNANGTIQSDGTVDVDVTSIYVGEIFGTNVDVHSNNSVTIQRDEQLSATNSLSLSSNNNITNSGSLTSSNTLNVDANTLTNNSIGKIKADGNNTINVNRLVNRGTVSSDTTLTLNADTTTNSGTLAAGSTLTINSDINNSNLLFAGSKININGDVSNTANIYSNLDAAISGGTITNTGGVIAAARDLSISGTILNDFSGSFNYTQGATETTSSYPDGDSIYSGSGARTTTTARIREDSTTTTYSVSASGDQGLIASGRNMTLSGNITNRYSKISAGNNLTVSGTKLTNINAQDKLESEVTVVEESWQTTCLQGSTDQYGSYTCYEPGTPEMTGEVVVDSYSEVTYGGSGSFGTIAAGGNIYGDLKNSVELIDGPTNTGSESFDTNASGNKGSASRGNGTTVSKDNTVAVAQETASSKNTNGASRSASGLAAEGSHNVDSGLGEISATNSQQTHSPTSINGASANIAAGVQQVVNNQVETKSTTQNTTAEYADAQIIQSTSAPNSDATPEVNNATARKSEGVESATVTNNDGENGTSAIATGKALDTDTVTLVSADNTLSPKGQSVQTNLASTDYSQIESSASDSGATQANQELQAGQRQLTTTQVTGQIDKNVSGVANSQMFSLDVNYAGLTANNLNPDLQFTQGQAGAIPTEYTGDGTGVALSPDITSAHNPDMIIKQQIDNQQGLLAQQQSNNANALVKGGEYQPPKNTHQVGQNVFITDAQMRVLTEDLGFDANAINQGQQSLYAAISHNDLMADGVTLSAGGTIDITAAEGFTIDAGISGGEGLILRSARGLDMTNLGFFDSENLLGLQLGGDFTNTLDLASNNLWLDIEGDITNLGSFTGTETLSLNAGGDLINQSLISGGTVSLAAKGDIINHTEFSQHTITDSKGNTSTFTLVGEAPQIVSTDSLSMDAGNNLDLQGSQLSAAGDIDLNAGNDVLLTAVEKVYGHDRTFKGGYDKAEHRTYDVVSLEAGGNLSVSAGNNLESEGAQFGAGGTASLSAGNQMNLDAVVESHYEASKKTKKSFLKKKVTESVSLHELVQGTGIDATNVLLNASVDAQGNVVQTESGDITLTGANINATDNVVAMGNNITVTAATYQDDEFTHTSKSSFGGLQSKTKEELAQDDLLSGTTISAGNNILMDAGDNLSIIASDVDANNIGLTAFNDVLIASGEESSLRESRSQSGGLFSGGSLYATTESVSGSVSTTANSSNLTATGNIIIDAGSATVVGSNLNAEDSISVSTDIGDIQVLAAQESTHTYTHDKSMSVSVGDALQGLTRPDELVSTDNGQLTFKVADAQYDEVNTTTTSTTHKASELNANGNITLDAISDITIEGSDINANGNANFIAQGDVTIKETVDTFNETTDETHGSAELSVVVQHQAVEVAKAAKGVDDAKDQLKQAESDYRRYQKETAQLENQLAQLEADLAAGKPGVTQADINEVASLLDDVKGDEAWYQAGIATASANVASKVTLLTQQTAAAAQSTATYGFNAGVQLDIAASQTSSNTQITESRGSSVNANNINILTGNDGQSGSTNIAGSALNAQNSLNVFTDELNLTASKNTQQSSNDSQSGNITIAQTLWGAAGGPTVNASLNSSEQQDKATTYTNSSLTANNLNVVTNSDANITGANLHGEDSLNLNVGGDLTLTSVQNRYSGSSKGFGISAGMGFGNAGGENNSTDAGTALNNAASNVGDTSAGAASANGGLNASTGRYQTTETVLTSITGGNVNVDVNGNTDITGALIAAIDKNGEDNGQLDLSTGTLSYSDLNNRSYSSNQSASVNANVGLTDAADPADPNQHTEVNLNSSNYTYQNESNQSLSKAMATVGEGNVTVGGEETEFAGLNRNAENTTNEIYDVDRQQGNIDLTVDHRLLSEEGRAQIAEDVETTAEKVSDIASTIGDGVEELTDALGITNLTVEERLELDKQINEALPSDLEALQLASAEIEEQTKEQQLTTMASNIFGDEVDPDATVQVTSQTGEVISISYREVMIDFMDRGADALHSFVDTVNDDSIQHVENQDVLIAAKNAAENYLATYNENKPLYDALENFASAPLIAKMVTEGVTDVAQATGILEKTAQTAGDLQGAAIASLQKLKAGFNKLTGSGAAKTVDDKVDDVASSKGSQSPPNNFSNGETDFYQVDPNDGNYYWPENLGFEGDITKTTIEKGTILDRFGSNDGAFMSPNNNSFESRALGPAETVREHHRFEVLKPLPVLEGKIAPAFGQEGGGTQILPDLPDRVNIQWLIDNKYLKEIEG